MLASTGTGAVMVPARPRVLGHMLTPRRHRDPAYTRRIAGELYGGTMRTHPERAAAALRPHAGRGAPRAATSTSCSPSPAGRACHALTLIRQPTLVLSGDDDPLIPTVNARILARGIPHARLHLYRGGHLALVTEAAELAPVIDRFLAVWAAQAVSATRSTTGSTDADGRGTGRAIASR